MQTSSPELDQKTWEQNKEKEKEKDFLHMQHVTVDWGDAAGMTDVLGQDVYAAHQFRSLPVVESQSSPGLHPE